MNFSTKNLLSGLLIIVMIGLGISCTKKSSQDPVSGSDNSNEALMSFEDFKKSVYQEKETGVYIVNGDEAFSGEAKLREFYNKLYLNGKLIVHQSNAVDVVWTATQRKSLTYCVSKSGFGSNYDQVVAAMKSSTEAWEAIADVDFIHKVDQDGNCTKSNNNVLFDVSKKSFWESGSYLARSFFPDETRSARNIIIAQDALDLTLGAEPDLIGVLRHELGHILGFRHEHTRPEGASKCFEDDNWRPVTDYDVHSVMHYPQCAQDGVLTDWKLTLTQKDIEGASRVYPKGTVETDQELPVITSFSVTPLTDGKAVGTVTLQASATDNKGVVNVEFFINDKLQKADNSAPYDFSWDTALSVNGTYTIKAIAYDLAGNKAEKRITVEVNNIVSDIDKEAPKVAITSPIESYGPKMVKGTVSIAGTASDNKAVAKVTLKIYQYKYTYINETPTLVKTIDATGTDSWNFSLDTQTLVNYKYHKIEAVSTDAAGNISDKSSVRIYVVNY